MSVLPQHPRPSCSGPVPHRLWEHPSGATCNYCSLVTKFCCMHSFATPWTIARQAPLSMGLSWQEYWSGLPFPFQRDLPDPGIEPASLRSPALAGRFFTTEPPGNPTYNYTVIFPLRVLVGVKWPAGMPPALGGLVSYCMFPRPHPAAKCFFEKCGSDGKKNLPANAGDIRDTGSIPGLGRSLEEENGNSLQYSCQDNPIDRGVYSPWGRKESDTTEHAHTHTHTLLLLVQTFLLQILAFSNSHGGHLFFV